MINPASLAAATVVGLAVVLAGPNDGFAQSKINERPHERANPVPRPPMRTQQGVIVAPIGGPIVGPIASPQRNAVPVPSTPTNRVGDRDGDRDRDHDRDRGAFAAGVAAGVVLGGAVASPTPGVYYVPAPSPSDDPVGYCTWMYSSYDPQSGTYIGDDGNPHPCPP